MTGVETRMDDAFGNASMRGPSLAVEPSSTRAGQARRFKKTFKNCSAEKFKLEAFCPAASICVKGTRMPQLVGPTRAQHVLY